MYNIRKAVVADVPQIYDLLKDFSQKGLMLPRSLSDLYDVIRSFHVAVPADDPGRVIGICALHFCWEGLGEIRSLSVSQTCQGSDMGRRLIEASIAEGQELGLTHVFVLTYIPEYFKKLDFIEIDKSKLPQKIWADCFKCVNFPDCGEIALEKWL